MHRFFIEKDALSGDEVVITGPVARQICDVLRLKPGENIIVLDDTSMEYFVTLGEVSHRRAAGKITAVQKCLCEPHIQVTLFQALTSRDKFEHILQKCTEVGVVRFVPVVTQRSIVRSGDKITDEKLHRRQAIITEAAEQSGRGVVPQLERPMSLSDAVEYPCSFDLKLAGSPETSAVSLKQILRNVRSAPVNIALFIGPEGGFSDSEMQFLLAKGVVAFELGRRILRTETAAVVASAIILYELDS